MVALHKFGILQSVCQQVALGGLLIAPPMYLQIDLAYKALQSGGVARAAVPDDVPHRAPRRKASGEATSERPHGLPIRPPVIERCDDRWQTVPVAVSGGPERRWVVRRDAHPCAAGERGWCAVPLAPLRAPQARVTAGVGAVVASCAVSGGLAVLTIGARPGFRAAPQHILHAARLSLLRRQRWPWGGDQRRSREAY